MIEATDLDVFIGEKRIVTGASFEARPGEFVSIVGPNGSGKTTLMRALCGDLDFSGEITFTGRSLSVLKPWQLAGGRQPVVSLHRPRSRQARPDGRSFRGAAG